MLRGALLGAMMTAAAGADAPAAGSYDLVCTGTVVDTMAKDATLHPFSTRLRVDGDRFCVDDCGDVFHLTEIRPDRIAYRYDVMVADKDHAANQFRGYTPTTAGPFDYKDEFSVDLASSAFHRFYRYDYGDPGSRPYAKTYDGRCSRAPFTPFPAAQG